jgi:hypothetical protein
VRWRYNLAHTRRDESQNAVACPETKEFALPLRLARMPNK